MITFRRRNISTNWFRKKWWDIKIAWRKRAEKKRESLKRKFLLSDLQQLRSWDINFTRLRYMESDGLLRSAMFKVKWVNGHCRITQYSGGLPIVVNKPKGPMKFRVLEYGGVSYRRFGMRRQPWWRVSYASSL